MSQSSAQVGWKTIIFDYNYQELDRIQSLAQSKGVKFVSQTTSRFGDDSLKPPDSLIDYTRQYVPEVETLSKIEPQCINHKKEYISAAGYYWPCCWISTAFTLPKSELWKNREQWSIQNTNLDIIREQLDSWTNQLIGGENPPETVCKMMCRPGNPTWPLNHGLT